jgi:hypothetical protein
MKTQFIVVHEAGFKRVTTMMIALHVHVPLLMLVLSLSRLSLTFLIAPYNRNLSKQKWWVHRTSERQKYSSHQR